MLEILEGCAYIFSLMFFYSGTIYFDMNSRKMRQEIEAQKKFQEVMQGKEFIKEYLNIMKSGKDEGKDD